MLEAVVEGKAGVWHPEKPAFCNVRALPRGWISHVPVLVRTANPDDVDNSKAGRPRLGCKPVTACCTLPRRSGAIFLHIKDNSVSNDTEMQVLAGL